MTGAEEVVASAQRRGALSTLMWGHLAWAEAALRTGLTVEAAARAAEALPLADQVEARIDRIRATVVLAREALSSGRPDESEHLLVQADRELADRPAASAYSLEAHAGIPELALDLLEAHRGDRRQLTATAQRGLGMLRRYARAVPIAQPRIALVEGRLAVLDGRHGAAHRAFARARRDADRLTMPWELADARARLGMVEGVGPAGRPR